MHDYGVEHFAACPFGEDVQEERRRDVGATGNNL